MAKILVKWDIMPKINQTDVLGVVVCPFLVRVNMTGGAMVVGFEGPTPCVESGVGSVVDAAVT